MKMNQVWTCLKFSALKAAENLQQGSVLVYMTCKILERK
jgi:hypothetical protein